MGRHILQYYYRCKAQTRDNHDCIDCLVFTLSYNRVLSFVKLSVIPTPVGITDSFNQRILCLSYRITTALNTRHVTVSTERYRYIVRKLAQTPRRWHHSPVQANSPRSLSLLSQLDYKFKELRRVIKICKQDNANVDYGLLRHSICAPDKNKIVSLSHGDYHSSIYS